MLTCIYQDSTQVYDNGSGTCPLWSTITNIETLDKFDQVSPIKVYPNPVTNEVNIELGNLGATTINIYTVTGQLISSQKDINESIYSLSLQGRTQGVYFLEIITEKNKYQQIIIKE